MGGAMVSVGVGESLTVGGEVGTGVGGRVVSPPHADRAGDISDTSRMLRSIVLSLTRGFLLLQTMR